MELPSRGRCLNTLSSTSHRTQLSSWYYSNQVIISFADLEEGKDHSIKHVLNTYTICQVVQILLRLHGELDESSGSVNELLTRVMAGCNMIVGSIGPLSTCGSICVGLL